MKILENACSRPNRRRTAGHCCRQEAEGHEDREEKKDEKEPGDDGAMILAVTACPTGIAHTYMAADALAAKAKEMGVSLKVETNGSTGVKNRLTENEIKRATAIIVAADKQVEMDRFHGKHVIQVPVADGIHKAETLIRRALKQDAPVYQGHKETRGAKKKAPSSFGFYKHLMNGVSNMLPFVVGGGIFIALSFVFGGIDAKGPVAELLMKIGGDEGAFHFLVPILPDLSPAVWRTAPDLPPGWSEAIWPPAREPGFWAD